MKRNLLWFFIFPTFLTIHAQEKQTRDENKNGTITGRVMDSSTRSPLEYATISLYSKGGAAPLDGTTTNGSGHFQITNVAPGTYSLTAESIGYAAVTLADIEVSERSTVVDVKNVMLPKMEKSMEAVVVKGTARVIENRIDKMVFNVEKDVTSQTGVATDVLKKVPQVSVDVDGNVELAGSSSVRFLINGKPSTAFGSNIADVLQTIPASQIKSIEVITNPGAKYDAEGIGGIINIILKKNSARGINGNVSLTAGTRLENGSFNFNARKGKLAYNAYFGGNLRPTITTPSSYTRYSVDTTGASIILSQDGRGLAHRGGFHSGMGIDYTINDKNSITGSIEFSHFAFKGSGLVNQLLQTSLIGTAVPDVASLNNTNNQFTFFEKNASLSYKKTFAKEDQELEVAANTSFGTNTSAASVLQFAKPQDSILYGTQSRNPGKENETEITVDYTQPLKKDVLWGMGGKFSLRDISSSVNALSYENGADKFVYDRSLSDSLEYHQKVYALYTEISFPVGNLFNAKIGGRYERTNIQSYYSNAQTKPDIPGYNTFVPSIFLSRKITDDQQVKLSYSKRIERPDFNDLDPFINTSDPKNLTSGNPYLKPEIGNRYDLGYSIDVNKWGNFMISAFYRTSNHDIQPYIVYYPTLRVGDSLYTNVSVSTRENVGLEKDAGLNLFVNFKVSDKFTLRGNFFAFRRHTFNAIDPGLNVTSFNFRSNLNGSYQFTNTLLVEFFGNFNSARHEVQGRYPSFTTYNIAIRKQFWNKNGSLALTANNPFNKYVRQQTMLQGPGFTVVSLRKIPFRSFGINFSWKFGKLEFKKDKTENTPNLGAPQE